MSSFFSRHSVFFIVFSVAFIFYYVTALPVSNNIYNKFINYLVKNNCTMPEEIELPFPTSNPSNFSYLSDPLKECQTSNAVKENDEASFLCREIFDVIQNITCVEYNTPLPKIKKTPLSQNICTDFKSLHNIFPKGDDYLSGKLVDGILCRLLCTGKYELLCKTLIWSYDVQAKIDAALENDEKENMDKETGSKMAGATNIKENSLEGKLTLNEEKTTNKITDKTISTDVTHTVGEENSADGSILNNPENPKVAASNVSGQTISDKTTTLANNSQSGTTMRTVNISQTSKVSVAEKNKSKPDKQNLNTDDLQPVEPNQSPQAKDLNQNSQSVNNALNQNSQSENNALNQNSQSEINDLNKNSQPENNEPDKNSHPENNELDKNSQPEDIDLNQKSQSETNSPNQKLQSKENVDLTQNEINANPKDSNSLTPELSSVTDKNRKNTSFNNLPDTEKSMSTNINNDENIISDNSVPQDNEMDNELSNVNIEGEEKETKDKPSQTNLKTDDKNETPEKPKLTDFETPLSSSKKDSESLDSTTVQIIPDEDIEHQDDDKDQEQYNNSFNPPIKNKESNVKSSVVEESNQISNSYETFISSRNNIGRVPDDIQVIPSFPEQEDSHFFFYFLSIVLILMAGYLIFHNKQKIIALIVEGRHERRRRSHGSGYKKLETK